MALITCPECGREISDKAAACPGCGCPMDSSYEKKTSEPMKAYAKIGNCFLILDENILTIQKRSGKILCQDVLSHYIIVRYKTYPKFIDFNINHDELLNTLSLGFYDNEKEKVAHIHEIMAQQCLTLNKGMFSNHKTDIQKVRTQQNLDTVMNMFSPSKTPHCPKCRSTQITYGGNRISLGRAVVGGAVAGGAGAAIGGLTGKKGYAVCLNCGKRWKI